MVLQDRKLDVFFEMEEKMITKSSLVSTDITVLSVKVFTNRTSQ